MAEETPCILHVAVAGPLPRLFDYLPPRGGDEKALRPGMRVLVPFGHSHRVGMIVDRSAQTTQAAVRLKPIEAALDEAPLLGGADLELILWAADYYKHAPGDALFSALPSRFRLPERPSEAGEPGWRLIGEGRAQAPEAFARAPRQEQVAALLRESGQELTSAEIARRLGNCRSALRAMAAKGWIEPCRVRPTPPGASTGPPAQGPELNAHQRQAVASVRGMLGSFHAFLLAGVTGSGKTEVYIHLLSAALKAGRQALVLVPEIGLTPQLRRRLIERIAAPMVTLHSGLNASERERAWRSAALGEARLVLGTRSAVFVPLPRLGLILVDEEHDLSFKQQDGFRYSARDLAVRRAQKSGCPVVLGSATPSLETLHNARSGRYSLLDLPERAGGARPPEIALLDIRSQPLRGGLSPVLVRLIHEQFVAGNQVLLFLNRRGFAPLLTCHDCGWVGECPRCDARLTLHLSDNRLWCHHCGLSRPVPSRCPSCRGPDLRPLGHGTERLEAELKTLFPAMPIARVDRDSTRRKGELDRLLAAARRGDYPLLLGTQMLSKGHHFPRVTLVGILDVDQGLCGADFRAQERMAQLVIQVAGRAGRAERAGRVVLQTRHPDHPLLRTLQQRGYPAFALDALQERRAAALPPFAHQALMRAESRDPEGATELLRRAMQAALRHADRQLELLGPVPAPMGRRAGRYRAQLLAQSNQRALLQDFLTAWLPEVRNLKGASRVRWSLDVDPQEML